MKLPRLLRSTLPALLLLVGAASALAADPPWTTETIVRDPEFQKRFLGSYGFLSGAEPKVNATEIESLREVLELLKANPRAAATVLQGMVGPDSSAALDFILANLQFQTGELEAARKNYESALDKFPDFRRAHKNLGLLLVQQQDFRGGLEHLSAALELGDRDGRSYGLIGYSYINLENFFAAEVAYRNAIMLQPDTRDWKLGLARSLTALGKNQEAVGLFESLIEEDPQEPTPWMLQANAYIGLDEPQKAAVNLETVRLLGRAQSSSLVLLGDIYMNAGMSELAKSAYLEVIEKDEDGVGLETATRAADLLIRSKAHAEAREILASVEKRHEGRLDQDQELELLTLQARLARGEGREKEAAKLLESIVERDGTRGDALLELASYYRGQGEDERALLLLERAEKLEDYEYRALLERAQLMVSARDYDEAAMLLRRALRLKSEPRVERFLARVEEARSVR